LSFYSKVLLAGLRARRICFRLSPFSLKVVLRNSNSALWLVGRLIGWLDWLEPAFFLDSSPMKMRRTVCPKMSVRIATTPCVIAQTREVLNPHILRQSLPVFIAVRYLATNQNCLPVDMKFSLSSFTILLYGKHRVRLHTAH